MSRFEIHRIDDRQAADQHYRAFWRIGGKLFRVQVWSLKQWLLIPQEDRPADVRPLRGPAFMTVRPMEEPECQDQHSENQSPLPSSKGQVWTRSRN